MPPTIQSGSSGADKRQRTAAGRSELVCKVKYCNTLPDIPFDPKFITYPFESSRFLLYAQTSLEKAYKHEVLTEHDLGVNIDLINPETYAIDVDFALHKDDEKLLEEDILAQQDPKRSGRHAKVVSWLHRTQYISTEGTRYNPQNFENLETKAAVNIKKAFKSEEFTYTDKESQIKAIDKTFEDAKKPIEKHYKKPGVTATEVLPVFPDFQLWKYPFAQVIFDSDPAPVGQPLPA